MNKWSSAFQVAAVYVGTVVGAGFATGKEAVEFFTQYGFLGLIGILVSGYLFIHLGTKMMMISMDIQAESYEDLQRYIFGEKLGHFVNVFVLIMLLGVSAVMLSGSGAVFEEQLHLPKQLGVLLTVFVGIFVILLGTKGLFLVNSFVVPLMIVFNLGILSISLMNLEEPTIFLRVPEVQNIWKLLFAPFAYTAFNLAMAQGVLVPIASKINDRSIIKLGAYMGGLVLTLILLSIHFSLSTLPDVMEYEIPMGIIMMKIGGTFFWLYVMIIYSEIFTSVIAGVYGIQKQLEAYMPNKTIPILLVIFSTLYSISFFDYSELLSRLYPLFGHICLIYILALWLKKS
ncbi:membrane protein [Bacillus coahuilensis p1.1.43]|uniref:Membrane protein n=1 Tax=Bacillus coahuilensis p1.1.43 TaxID=1150625 RepID=A0A147KAD5_9BACI|nr:hypothetical protein [Bacillus coahuilensis]KUP07598.1 membrane protein [Bacillus coahuilensis p1.1.43]